METGGRVESGEVKKIVDIKPKLFVLFQAGEEISGVGGEEQKDRRNS